MSDNICSYLKYKENRDTIKPMYRQINMLSTIFRRMNFKIEMTMLTELYDNFEIFVKELEKNDWNTKMVPQEIKDKLNKIVDDLNYRAVIRNMEDKR